MRGDSRVIITRELSEAVMAAVTEYLLKVHRPVNVERQTNLALVYYHNMQHKLATLVPHDHSSQQLCHQAIDLYSGVISVLMKDAEITKFLFDLKVRLWAKVEESAVRTVDEMVESIVHLVRTLEAKLFTGVDSDHWSFRGGGRARVEGTRPLELHARLREVLAEFAVDL